MFLPLIALLSSAPDTKIPPVPKFQMTIDSIMRGPALVGEPPAGVRWSEDGKSLSFRWAKAGEEVDQWSVASDGSRLKHGSGDDGASSPRSAEPASSLGSVRVSGTTLTVTMSGQHDKEWPIERTGRATLSSNGKKVVLTDRSSVRSLDIATGKIETIVSVKEAASIPSAALRISAPTTDSTLPTRSVEALQAEEHDLFPFVQGGGGRGFGGGRGRRGSGGGGAATDEPNAVALPAGYRLSNVIASADGIHAIVEASEQTAVSKPTIVPNYVTASGYTEDIPSYPKAGDEHGRDHVAFGAGGKITWIDFPGDLAKRDMSVERIEWSPDGAHCVMLIGTVDHKDRDFVSIDPATGMATILFAEHSDAWVGGPGSGLFGWLKDSDRFYFESEKTGFAHLYTYSFKAGGATDLTPGKYFVDNVRLSKGGDKFYYMSSEKSPFDRQLVRESVDGGAIEKFGACSEDSEGSPADFYSISPDETHVAYVRSEANRPPELYVSLLQPGAKETQVTSSPSAEWLSHDWIKPPIVTFKASDGVEVPARIYVPKHRNGAAVIFVHGAGYLQNVHNWWSYYYREYMFNQLLMSQGVTVLDIDYRASAGYGRDWRTAIYRHMGGRDLDDNVDGAKFLVAKYGVNPKRIGIYGGSYGGFITLMAMFTKPDVFAAGAALRPVSDWANYNDGYTTAILNSPQDDKEAYAQSSPINFAAGLKGNLLICHGVVDTNVHYQDTMRLVERLIDLRKDTFTVAPFPVENHGFTRETSWADEYKRIYALFKSTLRF